MKTCKECDRFLPVEAFGTYKARGVVYSRVTCKDCRNKASREQRDDTTRLLDRQNYARKVKEDKQGVADYYRCYHLRKNYGISLEEFNTLSALQDHKCSICSRENKVHENLVVDHNHDTGEIRGLLCSSCNTALGHAGDSPERLRKLASYLEERGYYGISD